MSTTEPTFDKDGYPTDETLAVITNWPHPFSGLEQFLSDAGYYPGFTRRGSNGWLELVTSGWSGNESLVSALRNNHVFWAVHWQASHRGGLHVFSLPPTTPEA